MVATARAYRIAKIKGDLEKVRAADDECWAVSWYLSDVPWLIEALREAQDALRDLADEAARAVCEPRRFHENEDQRQQALGQQVARARSVAR